MTTNHTLNLNKVREYTHGNMKITIDYGNMIVTTNPFAEQKCLHDTCPSCNGTGVKRDGTMCIHGISCPCPKCSFTC